MSQFPHSARGGYSWVIGQVVSITILSVTPPHDDCLGAFAARSVEMWKRLEEFGVPGIQGVWCHESKHSNLFNVISIKQMFAGQTLMAGLIASQFPTLPRYIVVVEEDIDPSNLEQLTWAMVTRGQPKEKIQILKNCRSSGHDPAIPLNEKKKVRVASKPLSTQVAVIDACRGLEWKEDCYPIAKMSPELRDLKTDQRFVYCKWTLH